MSDHSIWTGIDHILRLSVTELGKTSTYVDQLRAILAPTYEDPASILERELNHATEIYLGVRDPDEIRSFFMVGWEQLPAPSTVGGDAVYLGLSAERSDDHAAQDVTDLYFEFLREAVAWEAAHRKQLILWGTTATPVVFPYLERIFNDSQPHRDGSFTSEAADLAAILRAHHYPHAAAGDCQHPFVLKRVAIATRYSSRERRRLERIEKKHGFDLYQRLGISEPEGDRLLFICRVREPPTFTAKDPTSHGRCRALLRRR